jgi:hypothetical protein
MPHKTFSECHQQYQLCTITHLKKDMTIKTKFTVKFISVCRLAITGIFLLFALQVAFASPLKMQQSYEIYQQDGQYKMRGSIDFKEYFSSSNAGEVIQRAIMQTEKGGEIYLHSGKYVLKRTVHLESYITLKGAGPSTILMMDENHESGVAISGDSLDHVVIADLFIKAPENNQNTQVGIVLDHCGGCVVKDVFCYNMRDYGIWLRNNSFLCEIRGCKIANSGKSNILLEKLKSGGRGGDFVPNLVTNSMVYGGGAGIECDNAIVVNIVACQAYMTSRPGFFIHNQSNSVLISGSRTFQILDNAVEVNNSDEINVSGNIFCWHTGHGIVLNNVAWGTISGNNVIDTGHINIEPDEKEKWSYWVDIPDTLNIKQHLKNGISLTGDTRGLIVNSNAVFNWGSNPPLQHGIFESASCQNNSILGNNINYSQRQGVKSNGKTTLVKNNVIEAQKPYRGFDSVEKNRLHRFELERLRKFMEANNN